MILKYIIANIQKQMYSNAYYILMSQHIKLSDELHTIDYTTL